MERMEYKLHKSGKGVKEITTYLSVSIYDVPLNRGLTQAWAKVGCSPHIYL